MHKITLLAAVGAIAFSGCDFTAAAPATPANISSIEVSGLRGSNWDADGNPDVFVEIRSASGRTFFRSEPVADADISGTLTFDVSDVSVGSSTMPLFVSVFDFDDDLVHSEEMADSIPFTVQDLDGGSLNLGTGATSIVVRPEANTDV